MADNCCGGLGNLFKGLTPRQGVYTNDMVKNLTKKSNASHGYSKHLIPFKEVEIRMLRDLEDILPEYAGYPEGDNPIYAGDVCTLEMMPDGSIYFKHGCVYAIKDVPKNFIEGRDFEFV